MKIPKHAYTTEFKELAVKRVKDGQRIGAVIRELGLGDQTLRNWVKASAEGKLKGAGSREVTPEEMELSRLRAENLRLKRENEIAKKKRRRTLQEMFCEVRLDCRTRTALPTHRHVRSARCQHPRLPRLEARWSARSQATHRGPDAGADPCHSC